MQWGAHCIVEFFRFDTMHWVVYFSLALSSKSVSNAQQVDDQLPKLNASAKSNCDRTQCQTKC